MFSIVRRIKKKSKIQKKFENDINDYQKQIVAGDIFDIVKEKQIMIYEDNDEAANADQHYLLQDIYFSKIINKRKPENHYDIGSRVDGFISHLLAADVPVTMLDIRPFSVELPGLNFIQTDATLLEEIADNSLESLSSLHAIEHFGLGRYGDKIDPNAWYKALKAIQRKVKAGGHFYLGIPIGSENAVYFNAHRVFKPDTIIAAMDEMNLESFSYIHDYKVITVENNEMDKISDRLGNYDCGLFCFVK